MIVSPALLDIANDVRLTAPLVILFGTGFGLSKDTLNRVGGRVSRLTAVPVLVAGAAITPPESIQLGLGHSESAMPGSIVRGVSPHDARDAVIESEGDAEQS